MEHGLRAACRIYIASNAHFWKTHDIDVPTHTFSQICLHGGQITVHSTFFTMHLDKANLDRFHKNFPASKTQKKSYAARTAPHLCRQRSFHSARSLVHAKAPCPAHPAPTCPRRECSQRAGAGWRH